MVTILKSKVAGELCDFCGKFKNPKLVIKDWSRTEIIIVHEKCLLKAIRQAKKG